MFSETVRNFKRNKTSILWIFFQETMEIFKEKWKEVLANKEQDRILYYIPPL